jgi:4-hydroxysphinganine ceramide fatty acyl 2-hydroxylase
MTRGSPTTAFVTYASAAGVLIAANFRQGYVPGAWQAAVLFVAGVVAWTLFEYLVHRYVYHLASESELGARLSYLMHGLHHESPQDHSQIFVPPLVGVPVGAMLFGLTYAILGTRAPMIFSGFLVGYIAHACVHYCIHHFRPPRMLKFLWRHHLLHHYRCPDLAYGVSSPVWDMVFRTMPPARPRRTRLEGYRHRATS